MKITMEETERGQAEQALSETEIEQITEEIQRLEYSQALEYTEVKQDDKEELNNNTLSGENKSPKEYNIKLLHTTYKSM